LPPTPGSAGLAGGADQPGVAGHCDGYRKNVSGIGVGGFQVDPLRPGRAAAPKHIGRSGPGSRVVELIANDAEALLSSEGEPTTTVSASSASAKPKQSLALLLAAFR